MLSAKRQPFCNSLINVSKIFKKILIFNSHVCLVCQADMRINVGFFFQCLTRTFLHHSGLLYSKINASSDGLFCRSWLVTTADGNRNKLRKQIGFPRLGFLKMGGVRGECWHRFVALTHGGWNNMAAILQTTFSKAFFLTEYGNILLQFGLSTRVQLSVS